MIRTGFQDRFDPSLTSRLAVDVDKRREDKAKPDQPFVKKNKKNKAKPDCRLLQVCVPRTVSGAPVVHNNVFIY